MQRARVTPQGVNLDIDPVENNGASWTRTDNMVPRPGHMERARGWTPEMGVPLFAPYYIQYSPQIGEPFWVYCGTTGIAYINTSSVHADITPPELTVPVGNDEWTGGNLNGIAVLNSPQNVPFYWFNPNAVALPLPGLRPNTFYNVMRPFKYHLIGLGVTDGGGQFLDALHWSNAADPGNVPDTWQPAPDNEAGDNILADENGAIIDGLALRDGFYIYKQDSVYEMSYVGGNAVFRFRKVFGTTGILARNCVVEVEGTHIVLGNGDIYRHDGQNLQSLVDGVLRDTFFSQIDSLHYQNSFVIYNEPRQEVWFCVPQEGETRPSLALVYNVTTGNFGYRSLPACDFGAPGVVTGDLDVLAWEDDTRSWESAGFDRWSEQRLTRIEDQVVLCDAQGVALYEANKTLLAAGEGYGSAVEITGIDLGDAAIHKGIRRIWPRINAPMGMQFNLEVYTQRETQSPLEKQFDQSFSLNGEGVPCVANGRYMGLRISTEENQDWDIAGFDVEYVPRGRF